MSVASRTPVGVVRPQTVRDRRLILACITIGVCVGGGLKEALQSVSLKISSWLVGVLYLDIINEDIVLVCALALLCLVCGWIYSTVALQVCKS